MYAQPASTGADRVSLNNMAIMSSLTVPWTQVHVTATIAAGETARRFRQVMDAGAGKSGARLDKYIVP